MCSISLLINIFLSSNHSFFALGRDNVFGPTEDLFVLLLLSPSCSESILQKHQNYRFWFFLYFLYPILIFRSLSSRKQLNMEKGADREGEGEFKIFEHISNLPKGTSCLTVTSDSDVVLFSLYANAAYSISFS